MYAVIDAQGFQFKVEKGDRIQVPRLSAEEGASVEFDKVLILSDSKKVTVGTPFVEGAKVVAKVLVHGKTPKVVGFKFKRRKNYRRMFGHKQDMTEVLIETVSKP
jgi:large subunit ribosomal protein L21